VKLKSVHIRNFKGVKEVVIDFGGPSGPRYLTALLGDNGSGKTTVLQAIAFVLSLASGRTQHPDSFNWPGFEWDRISSLGDTSIELVTLYSLEEFYAIHEMLSDRDAPFPVYINGVRLDQTPREALCLTLGFGNLHPNDRDMGPSPVPTAFLKYGTVIQGEEPPKRLEGTFPDLGNVYWFDQLRNIGSIRSGPADLKPRGNGLWGNWASGVQELREILIAWWGVHTSSREELQPATKLRQLETLMDKLFQGTKFAGMEETAYPATTPELSDYFFLLERDGNRYDISEMSSGEQAIFPLLFEFVRLDMAESSSLVLIDELELHLHPPEQQALFRALPIIGPDCQYIITTHSEVLTDVIPNEWEVRLDKGRVI